MGRPGKIAGMPREIREKLNERMQDGEGPAELAQWLNSLPEVKAVLEEKFDGKPLTEQNLHDWKRSGFADWTRHQDMLQVARLMTESRREIAADVSREEIMESLSILLALELTRQLQRAGSIINEEERRKVVFSVGRQFAQLRRSDATIERLRLERERLEAERATGETEAQANAGVENSGGQSTEASGRQAGWSGAPGRMNMGQTRVPRESGPPVAIVHGDYLPAKTGASHDGDAVDEAGIRPSNPNGGQAPVPHPC